MSQTSSRSSSPSTQIFDQPTSPTAAKKNPPSNALNIIAPPSAVLHDPAVLESLRTYLEIFAAERELNSFSPIKALRRIQVSYTTVEAAVAARRAIAAPGFFNKFLQPAQHTDAAVRVGFAKPVPVVVGPDSEGEEERRARQYLAAPKVDKLHFISPPPSPPAGWEVRFEDPPNKTTHPDDLVRGVWGGLAGAPAASPTSAATAASPVEDIAMGGTEEASAEQKRAGTEEGVRVERRSSSTTYFYETKQRRDSDPADRMVDEGEPEPVAAEEEEDVLVIHVDHPADEAGAEQPAPKTIIAHTARPPSEAVMC